MTRRLLAMLLTLGVVVTAVGFTGIYAVLTDRAKTGDLTVNTGERPKAADLLIAATGQPGPCAEENYVDDLSGPQFTLNNAQPGISSGINICLKNAGSAALDVHEVATDVSDTDTACSNNEPDFGDQTCGSDGQGELSPVIHAMTTVVDCQTFETISQGSASIGTLAAYQPQAGTFEAWDPGVLQPNQVICLFINISYPAVGDGTTEAQAQVAQTDSLSWRLAFDGTPS